MYSNEKKGFSILDIIVKIILFGLFILILVWLFNKKVPNMTPFYSNVFRENIKYMQEAAESYFTDDKMPKEIGGEVKMTLSEMIEKKIILPFVDKNGNSCDLYNSYVSITKQEDESFRLKTNLECGEEKDYTIKILGCHTYCKDNNCEKTCRIEQIISYQYRKLVTTTSTKYSCPSGYTLKGKDCYKTVLTDSKSAEVITTETKTYTEDALAKVTSGTKTELEPIATYNKSYVDKITGTTKSYTDKITGTTKSYTDKITSTTKSYTEKVTSTTKSYTDKITTTTKSYTDKITTKNPDKTTCTETTKKVPYDCNCTTKTVNFKDVVVCSTCYKNVTTETCTTTPGATTYSCPSGYTKEGSGSSLKCYKNVTSYSCPSGYTKEGSGSSLKCYKNVTSYSCPSGYTKEGSGSSLKCYKNVTSYSCPSGYTKEGSGSSLKCYKNVTSYSCPSGYTKEGSGSSLKCYKYVATYSCPSGYTKEGSGSSLKCYKYVISYSCPTGTDYKEGSGTSLKCYDVKEGTIEYYCADKSYTLKGDKCVKTVKEQSTKLECDDGYKLEGKVCNKYKTDKENAKGTKVTNKSYKYTWSTNPSLAGWEKTGKTKVTEGKEICE